MTDRDLKKLTPWKIVMLFLSIYVLCAILYDIAVKPGEHISTIIRFTDTVICLIFIGDFFHNLSTAKDKWGYLKWGWIDLVSSVPVFNELRWGRLVRIIFILRLFRGYHSTKMFLAYVFKRKGRSAFAIATLASIMITFCSSIIILNCEKHADSNIKTAEDAIWWACSTVTGVGYGDKYPTTTEGRIIGIILMTAGVGLFLTFTGFMASWFVGVEEEEEEEEDMQVLKKELRAIKDKLSEIETHLQRNRKQY